jgi:hypothetical protein
MTPTTLTDYFNDLSVLFNSGDVIIRANLHILLAFQTQLQNLTLLKY